MSQGATTRRVWLRQPGCACVQGGDAGGTCSNPSADLYLLHHHTEGCTTSSPHKPTTALQLWQEGAGSPAYQVRASNLLLPSVPEQKDATSLCRASRARTEILKPLLTQAREDSPSNLSFGSYPGSAWRSTAQGRSQLRLLCRKAICLLETHSPRQACCLKDYSRQSYAETIRPFHSQGKQKEIL